MALRYEKETSSYDRALSFFDAVYGFALTLLVTTIHVTGVSTWQSLGAFLDSNGNQLLSFAISFVLIAVFWRKNHELLAQFTALDGVTIWANICVMSFVVFLPFTTRANGDPQLQHLPLPTAIYAFNVAAAILASIVMYQIALRRGLVENVLRGRARWAQLIDSLTTPLVFLFSIPVAYLSVSMIGTAVGAKLFWLVLFLVRPITGRWAERVTAA